MLPNVSGVFLTVGDQLNSLTQLQQPITGLFPHGTTIVYWCQNGTKFEDGRASHSVKCDDYGRWTDSSTTITCSGLYDLLTHLFHESRTCARL